jgi:putative ABC transport system permease protein
MELLHPAFYRITGYPEIAIFTADLVLIMLATAGLSGLLAGIYPALLISARRPLAALQGLTARQRSAGWVRRGLVVFQFSISAGLIVGVLTVAAQMNYIQEKDLGFDKENLFVLRVNGYDEVIEGYEAFRAELSSIPGIEGAARSNSLIVGGLSNGQIETVNEAGESRSSSIYRLGFDADFLDVYDIELLAGRSFSREYGTDTTAAFLVNEATLATFGWPDAEAAIGKPIRIGDTQGQVVGVVENFHFSSLHEAVQPVLMYPNTGNFSRITLRSRLDPATTVDRVRRVWEEHFPQALYDYTFFEGELLEQYQAEQRFGRLFSWFSALSLFIACLGLFGLAAFSAERRAREISIRKVLGASATQIIGLLNRDFLRLVLLALLLATPVAWYAMNHWLDNFAYHITFQWWIPALAGATAIGLALLTVSALSLRAAGANPADHLRDQ